MFSVILYQLRYLEGNKVLHISCTFSHAHAFWPTSLKGVANHEILWPFEFEFGRGDIKEPVYEID